VNLVYDSNLQRYMKDIRTENLTLGIGKSGLVISLSGIATLLTCFMEYLHVLKYLLFIVVILRQKGVMQTYSLRLQTFKRELSRLYFCKPTRLHHSFLL